MHVLDFLRKSFDWKVKVPLYHRGHLSLRPGTTVHLSWVVRTSGDPDTSILPEVFGTTLHNNAWASVYRISAALYDAPGVLHKALQSIARHGGNVLQLDSTSTERETHHNVEMIVDFASLFHDDEPTRDLSAEIEGLLLADCASHIVADADRTFLLSVRAVSSLRRMNSMLSRMRVTGPLESVSTYQVDENGDLKLGQTLQDMLTKAGVKLPFKYLVTSDTTDRVFRITFFPAAQPALWCSIGHADKQGALESITDALQRSGITILCALNRVQEHLGQNWFDVVLSNPAWRDTGSGEIKISPESVVRQLLESAELDTYQLKWFFRPKDASAAMKQHLTASNSQAFVLKRENVNRWIEKKETELLKVREELKAIDTRDRTLRAPADRYARALEAGITKVRRETDWPTRRIFLSVEFTNQNSRRIKIVEEICREHGMTLEVVREPKDQKTIWHAVVARMEKTTHFIAIWTPSKKGPKNNKRPSPWCLWELGIANALKLPFYVLLDADTEVLDYTHIHHDEFYYEFRGGAQFAAKLASIVEDIAASDEKTPRRRWYDV